MPLPLDFLSHMRQQLLHLPNNFLCKVNGFLWSILTLFNTKTQFNKKEFNNSEIGVGDVEIQDLILILKKMGKILK